MKNIPIAIDAKVILKNFTKKFLLNSKKFLFFKKMNKTIALNHEEIEVAMNYYKTNTFEIIETYTNIKNDWN